MSEPVKLTHIVEILKKKKVLLIVRMEKIEKKIRVEEQENKEIGK